MSRREIWRWLGFISMCAVPACGLILPLPDVTDDSPASLGGASAQSGGARSEGGGIGNLGGDTSPAESSGGSWGGAAPTGGWFAGSGGTRPVGSGGYPSSGGTCMDCECADNCDCDEDGVLAIKCGGDDCDDKDARVHPGQTAYFPKRSENDAIGFDYDCSGYLERPLGYASVNCGAISLVSCNSSQGFLGTEPSCGQAGEWGTCSKTLLGCEAKVVDAGQVMLCH